MWDFLMNSLPTILTAIIAIALVWKYLSKILVVLKEVSDVLVELTKALEDKQLTKEEIEAIIKEVKDIPAAIKAAFQKEQ